MRILKYLILLIVIAGAGAVFVYLQVVSAPLVLRAERVEFTIPAGAGLNAASELIANAGLAMPGWQLALIGRAMGRASQIKAGSYEIHRGINPVELIDMLTRGDVRLAKVTLVEGKTFREFRQLLNAHPELAHDSAVLTDAQIAQRLNAPGTSLEGWFLPETYLFDKYSSDLDVLRRAHDAMTSALNKAWAERDPTLPVASAAELLTLASMVEKETGQPADRPQIASVFANRLRAGMPLQSDPTVIYGMGSRFDGNLRRADLQTDTPWNTYTRPGLPPTPICVPGTRALAAASQPPPTSFLYFVARGDGSSAFSTTLDEHNRAVTKFQKRSAH